MKTSRVGQCMLGLITGLVGPGSAWAEAAEDLDAVVKTLVYDGFKAQPTSATEARVHDYGGLFDPVDAASHRAEIARLKAN
jgi:hypothetical protein